MEKHYTVKEIAEEWKFSVQTVTRFFENEPGIICPQRKARPGEKRKYRSMRIPESVKARVYRRMQQ